MAKKKKLLAGLSNIHFAPRVNGIFETPIKIQYAKKIENKLNYESDPEWADDRLVEDGFMFSGGEGTLSVLALTSEEQAVIFGNTIVKGGIKVNSNDIAPEGAFLFERKKKRSNDKRLYVVYSCVCSPSGISAETIEEGKGAASVDEISYSIGQMENGDIYYYVDTEDTTVNPETITKWFEEVQIPENISASSKIQVLESISESSDAEVIENDSVESDERTNSQPKDKVKIAEK